MDGRLQKRIYESYLEARGCPPTRLGLLLRNRRYWVLFVAGFGATAGLYFFAGLWAACLIFGMLLGATFYMLGANAALVKTWPCVEKVIDWEKLKKKLK